MNKQQFEQYKSIPKEKFAFATAGDRIHDRKLDTKPTTFAKDAFKRFCKNKSSVVAAIILGILLLFALIVPLVSPYGLQAEDQSTVQVFLTPKLFNAGTGFWDGTVKYGKTVNRDGSVSAQIYDFDRQAPAGNWKTSAVMNLVVDSEPSYIDKISPYGQGGYVMFENNATDGVSNAELVSDTFKVTADGNYSVAISIGADQDVNGGKLGEYRIYLLNGNEEYLLQDWTTAHTSATFDLSAALPSGTDTVEEARLAFELKSVANVNTYMLLESMVFSADESVDNLDRLAVIGYTNPNVMVALAKDTAGNFPDGYWHCTGRKGIYHTAVYYCTFTYDTYEAAFGLITYTYGKSDLDKFIKNGWCKYDANVGPESFEKLSDECPIEEVLSQSLNDTTGKLLDVTVKAYNYKVLGYKTMPKFIFGTDDNGLDLFTRMFTGLRTSFFLSVAIFAICFVVGILWGSISGYFGGTVDLVMERITDILGYIPTMVIITLSVLYFGQNFGQYVFALCLTGWIGSASRTRTQFYRFKKMEHVLASRTLGASDWRLIFKHVLPNSLGTLITSSVLTIPSLIAAEAGYAYLGLVKGMSSFGVMLSENQHYLSTQSYLIVIPSIVMALLMISFNLFGNGLRDAINPTLKGSEG